MTTTVTTHVLDTALGRPASGVPVTLEQLDGGRDWRALGTSATDADGRARGLPPVDPSAGPVLRLRFETSGAFFPEVSVVFTVDPGQEHYHVPLLLSPFGYSVYRGS